MAAIIIILILLYAVWAASRVFHSRGQSGHSCCGCPHSGPDGCGKKEKKEDKPEESSEEEV